MGRVLGVLLLIVVLVLLVGFMRGWFSVDTQDSEDASHYQFSVDKKNVKNDADNAREEAKQIGEKTREEARVIGRKIDDAVHSKDAKESKDASDASDAKDGVSGIALEKTSIEMSPNSKRNLKVTRSGPDLKPLQLGLKPSSGSNLLASGGAFKDGDSETAITIEAPSNAHDGSIAISGYGQNKELKVSIEPALVPVTHEPDGAASAREQK